MVLAPRNNSGVIYSGPRPWLVRPTSGSGRRDLKRAPEQCSVMIIVVCITLRTSCSKKIMAQEKMSSSTAREYACYSYGDQV